MTLRNIMKINSTLVVFLIISLLGNNSAVTANLDHVKKEIDISNGYSSGLQTLEWNAELVFEFEITEPADYTFEIFNINAALFYFSFNHEGPEPSSLSLLDPGANEGALVEEGEIVNHDNLPVGAHIEVDVLRHLKITEAMNYTLTFNNEHEHEADPVQFEFKFTEGLNGVETFGTVNAATEDDAPGFGLIFSIAALFIIVFTKQKFLRSKRL